MASGHHSIYDIVGVASDMQYVAAAGVSAVTLGAVGLYVNAKIKAAGDDVLPEGRFSIVNASVEVVKGFRNLLQGMIEHGSEKFVPIITTTFLYLLFCNLFGMIPFFKSATANINNNLAVALFIFIAYNVSGFREHGIGYLKQLTGGITPKGYPFAIGMILAVVTLLIVVIESVGHVVRVGSLSLRLWGAINGDHALVNVFSDVLPFFIPVLAMTLGLLVSVIQALVFSLLSSVYFKLAVSHDH